MRPPVTVTVPAAAGLVIGLGLGLTGCGDGGSPELSVRGGFVPQPVMAGMAAGYLTLRNDGGADDRLTSVTADIADAVTLHHTEGNRMRRVEELPVPAGGELDLARGGDHLMLEKLGRKPAVGEKVTFTLHFATSDPIKIKVPVEATTYRPED
jgi:copper(I)-binding protein